MARGSLSFGYFSLAAQRALLPRTAKLRFGFSSSTRRQGETSTMKVTASAHKRRLTNNQHGGQITMQSNAG